MEYLDEIYSAKLVNILPANFTSLVSDDATYEVARVPALELLNSSRLDIVAKYMYAKYKKKNIKCGFAQEVYLEHIRAFNNYVEADGSNKIGKDKFLESMDELQASIKKTGFLDSSLIPLSREGVILDGSHRVGISLALDQQVSTVLLDVASPQFDYRFFRGRGVHDVYMDSMAFEYAKLKTTTRLVILWPASEGRQSEVEDVLREYGDIVYFKEVHLNQSGAHNLVRIAYKGEPWLGTVKDGYAGVANKARWCFSKKGSLRIFLFESTKDLIEMKDKIRKIFNVDKHSIHINDTHEETIELTEYLFNENGVTLLNGMVCRDLGWFERLFSHYQNWLQINRLDKMDFCIDGSGVLAVFGIRDVRDLDFLYSGDGRAPNTSFKEIDCHNDEHQHEGLVPDEIIYDPRNHFYYSGFKFVSINLIRELKVRRDEVKDRDDVRSIDGVLSGNPVQIPWKSKVKRIFTPFYIKAKIKLIALKLRYHFVRLKNGIK